MFGSNNMGIDTFSINEQIAIVRGKEDSMLLESLIREYRGKSEMIIINARNAARVMMIK